MLGRCLGTPLQTHRVDVAQKQRVSAKTELSVGVDEHRTYVQSRYKMTHNMEICQQNASSRCAQMQRVSSSENTGEICVET